MSDERDEMDEIRDTVEKLMHEKAEGDEMPLDEALGKDLERRLQMSQDAADYHERELVRHRRIVESCSSGLSVLSQPQAKDVERLPSKVY